MLYLRIEPQKEGKGRTFMANLIAYVTADTLWEQSAGDGSRPVWLSYAASEGEVRPFTANLRMGKKAEIGAKETVSWRRKKEPYLELLKSVGYEFTTQRFVEGTVMTAFLPELFRLDPGMVDPQGAKFIVLPPQEWLDNQNVDVDTIVSHCRSLGYIDTGLLPNGKKRPDYEDPTWPSEALVRQLAPMAPLFVSYLDRRTRAPLIQDARFHTQLLIAALKNGVASLSVEDSYRSARGFGRHAKFCFMEKHTKSAGLAPGVAFSATHDKIEALLAEEVSVYFKHVG